MQTEYFPQAGVEDCSEGIAICFKTIFTAIPVNVTEFDDVRAKGRIIEFTNLQTTSLFIELLAHEISSFFFCSFFFFFGIFVFQML